MWLIFNANELQVGWQSYHQESPVMFRENGIGEYWEDLETNVRGYYPTGEEPKADGSIGEPGFYTM